MKKKFHAYCVVCLAVLGALFLTGADWNRAVHNPMLLCFGDDITAGTGSGQYLDDASESYPSLLAAKINIPVVNAGCSGDTTAAALLRLNRDVLSRNPEIVIINLGMRDLFEDIDIEFTLHCLTAIVSNLSDGKRKVYLTKYYSTEMLTRFMNDKGMSREEQDWFLGIYEEMFEDLAFDYGVEIVPAVWNGVWGIHMSGDLLPDRRGYEIMANNYNLILRPYLTFRKYYR